MEQLLKHTQILITRPETQTTALSARLSSFGASVLSLAVIDIEPIAASAWPVVSIAEQDMVVFVSRNAVICFKAEYSAALPDKMQCVAVGAATAKCMTEHGFKVAIQAPSPAGSESLLALPTMQNMANKRVLIVRGETGRELLADTLRARAATITYLEVYRRCVPTYGAEKVAAILSVDWLVVTSVTGLENLCQIVNNEAIKLKMMLVVSERIKQIAVGLGFQHVVVSDDVSDDAVINRIVEIGQDNGKEY